MKQPDRHVLGKILDEIEYLEELLQDVSMEEFIADETVKRAAAMASINIGELAKHLSKEFYEKYPGSELKYAAKTRDVYAHGYYTLRFEAVYKTAVEDYPRVKQWILNHWNTVLPVDVHVDPSTAEKESTAFARAVVEKHTHENKQA